MTRINLVPPSELSRQHLIAEYRELPRLFGLIRAAIERGEKPDDSRNPTSYVLGKGHVRFFYNKINWLAQRFTNLVREMERRGYRPSYFIPNIHGLPLTDEWNQVYWPTPQELLINRQRIAERSP